jgi:RNA polymerase sigma-70 factor (ECF subfamily)
VASDEAALVARLRAGDDEAFAELVSRAGGRMLAVARRFLRHEEDARDVVQESFLAAFRAIHGFDASARLTPGLHRIVVNHALMRLRRAARHPEVAIDELLPRFDSTGHHVVPVVDWSDDAEATLLDGEVRAQVRACIDRLPDTHRTVLLLRDIEERSTGETAAALGISENAVKVRLHRARQALRTLLEPLFRPGD